MSNVQTEAERDNVDLTHFVYSTGSLGRLKVLSAVPVVAGDSFELKTVGAFRLAPFRRGLSVDSNVDIFTFYIPHRHSYGQSFVDAMRDGIPETGSPALLGTDTITSVANRKEFAASFLGTHVNLNTNVIPKYLYQSYLRIFNHYFKMPFNPDITAALSALSSEELNDGLLCANLEAYWTKPLNPNTDRSSVQSDVATNDGIDIFALNTAYAKLHTRQEREHFMQRYRDVMSNFGGSTHYDADQRPHLVMRSNFWASGYDTDGTTQETLGQFSGRVQQSFSHTVPRFYVPEHGVMMTLMLVRFPPIHALEMHTLVGKGTLDYLDLACDPVIVGNLTPAAVPLGYIFEGYTGANTMLAAQGQHYRYHPNHVDNRYSKLQGFPFYYGQPVNQETYALYDPRQYDQCFQTTQLGHWNIQTKMNCHVKRHIPSARDSIMTN